MDSTLLHYFNEELSYLRHGVKQFAERYPHVASRLHLGSEVMEDPHVTRLLEAFALLTSRVRNHQEANFAQLRADLLSVLFPHYVAPIPSMAIIEFYPDEGMSEPVLIERGKMLSTPPLKGKPLNFTTCYDTQLVPVKVTDIKLHNISEFKNAEAYLSVSLAALDAEASLNTLLGHSLRFYINESFNQALTLYQQIMSNCAAVVLVNASDKMIVAQLEPQRIKPVGFDKQESLLPWFEASAPRWRLLSEYFSFKEKFLFFDLDLSNTNLDQLGSQLELQIHFKAAPPKKMNFIHKSSLKLNSTPVINLFKKTLEPMELDGLKYEYPTMPDKNYPNHYEVHTIEQVIDISAPQTPKTLAGLLEVKTDAKKGMLWTAQRKYDTAESHTVSTVYLAFTQDLTANHETAPIVEVAATCFNANIPSKLYLSEDNRHLQWVGSGPLLGGVRFLTQPTEVHHRQFQSVFNDQLIAQLAQNYLSLSDADSALAYIKNLLLACNVGTAKENKAVIDSVESVAPEQTMRRIKENLLAPFAYGTELTVTLRNEFLADNSVFLFSEVLKRSIAVEVPVNSFIDWKFVVV